MSRIGKLPIAIPEGVEVTITDTNLVTVKGPLGELSQQVDKCLTINKDEGNLIVERGSEEKQEKAYHGLYRSLLSNMVEGVSKGYKKELESLEDLDERKELFDKLVAKMYEVGQAIEAASFLEIDAVIDPVQTRDTVLKALKSAKGNL